MVNVHIVTDSGAHFASAQFLQQHPVTVVPNKLTINGKVYREGIDLSPEEALKLIANQPKAPLVTLPTTADYGEIYGRLARDYDGIISIHASREIYPSWQNARVAAQQMVGSCQVAVIDSQTLDAAQGMLVAAAARAIKQEATFDDMVRVARGAVDRLYSIYYVESLDFLLQNQIMTPSHTILGTMLGIKPFVTIEDGKLMPIEKVKTRGQAVERLVEFAVEFTEEEIEDVLILQHRAAITEQTRGLQDRLALEFPERRFAHAVYGATLAALIGADAAGMVILERESDEIDDDF
jgi:DegV family protein with EDD domain